VVLLVEWSSFLGGLKAGFYCICKDNHNGDIKLKIEGWWLARCGNL